MNAPQEKPSATIGTMAKRKMVRKRLRRVSRYSVARPTSMIEPSDMTTRPTIHTMFGSAEAMFIHCWLAFWLAPRLRSRSMSCSDQCCGR